MGIKERQERDREAVGPGDSRTRPATSSSPRASRTSRSARSAERIEYSPAAIYGYFPSKDDIFFALAPKKDSDCWATRRPFATIRFCKRPSPLDRIRAIFWRLYEFSRDQPQYFALMFVDRSGTAHQPRIRAPLRSRAR